jgi:hypothetical protein
MVNTVRSLDEEHWGKGVEFVAATGLTHTDPPPSLVLDTAIGLGDEIPGAPKGTFELVLRDNRERPEGKGGSEIHPDQSHDNDQPPRDEPRSGPPHG